MIEFGPILGYSDGTERTGVSVVEWVHCVEHVGDHIGACLDSSHGLLVICPSMPYTDHNSVRCEILDGFHGSW